MWARPVVFAMWSAAACSASATPHGSPGVSAPRDEGSRTDAARATPNAIVAADAAVPDAPAAPARALDTILLIVMENHSWAKIAGNRSAPYINDQLVAEGAHAEDYHHAPHTRVSEPNYIWLEAGDDYGLTTDQGATAKHSIPAGTPHLTALLEQAGVSWTAYEEDMPDGVCPLGSHGRYVAKHDPFVFFRDVTDDNNPASKHCLDHIVPLDRLAADLAADRVARYIFITPNVCHDMHGGKGLRCPKDLVKAGDDWLSNVIPRIEASPVYQRGHAAILITWDEGSGNSDQPIGMIAISPDAKAGYASKVRMSHSSTLRTLEEVFGVTPLLGDAVNANSLADLFVDYP